MTPPDSVGKVAELVALLRDRANDHGGDKLLTDAADCLQALDRQRQEEVEHRPRGIEAMTTPPHPYQEGESE